MPVLRERTIALVMVIATAESTSYTARALTRKQPRGTTMRNALLTSSSILGSDALIPLDGRWSRATIHAAVLAHVAAIRHLHPGVRFTGYTLYGKSIRGDGYPVRVADFA
jgi:hypothetical protein